MSEMTPREIVSELDKHIIGQDNAKRSVAIALRNRWRRMQLNGGFDQMALMHFQFTFKQFEQRKSIRSTARKARDDFVVVQTADLFHVAFHYGIAQRGLTITSDDHMAVTAYAYYSCHELTPWLRIQSTNPIQKYGA